MKKAKMILSGAILMVALGSAFATKAVNAKVLTTVYYYNSLGQCVSADISDACTNTDGVCLKNVPGFGTTQIYQSQTDETTCATPLKP